MEPHSAESSSALALAQQRIAELEEQLSRAEAQGVRHSRLTTLGQVAGNIAHELRDPLNVIRTAIFLMKRELPDDSACQRYLDVVEHATADAERSIASLLALSRGQPPRTETVDLRPLCEEARAGLRRPAQIVLHYQADTEPFLIDVDRAQFDLVLRNLFANAAQAMHDVGRIDVRARATADEVEILVADEGPGIPAMFQGQIFEPLFTTRKHGTGLGLTICRQVVEAHHGSIALLPAESGTTFRILLPRQEPSHIA